jgi:hypothetical protein
VSFTDQKPRLVTEAGITARWGGNNYVLNFRCGLCGYRFRIGQIWNCATAEALERIAELEEGLEPFAAVGERLIAMRAENSVPIHTTLGVTVNVGHLRRAAELLKTKGVTDTPSAIRPTPENTLQKNP